MNKNNSEIKREIEKKEYEIKSNQSQIENYKIKLEEAQKLLEENEKVIRFLNNNLNASYLPFKNVLKNETILGGVTLNNQINAIKKAKEENHYPLNDPSSFDSNYNKTQNSFTKQPYFNSMAFQSGNSIGGIATGKYHSNLNNNHGTSNSLNSMILPETNFTGYKNLINKNEINLQTNNLRLDSEQGHASKIFILTPIRKWK